MPLLQLGPPVVLLTRACAISFMLFCLLVSPAGIFYNHQARVVSFDCGQEHCTGSLIFFICWTGMLLWVEAVITAAWEFAVSYLACTWYFDDPKLERKSGTTLWKLSYTLLRYHLGSMVKAAVVIGFLRPFRFIFGTITQVARMEYNPLRGLIFFFLGCFVHLYEQHFDRRTASLPCFVTSFLDGAHPHICQYIHVYMDNCVCIIYIYIYMCVCVSLHVFSRVHKFTHTSSSSTATSKDVWLCVFKCACYVCIFVLL